MHVFLPRSSAPALVLALTLGGSCRPDDDVTAGSPSPGSAAPAAQVADRPSASATISPPPAPPDPPGDTSAPPGRAQARWLALGDTIGALEVAAGFVPGPEEVEAAYASRGYVPAGVETRGNAFEVAIPRGPSRRLAALEVENRSELPVHLTVLSIADDRSQNVIHPPASRAAEEPPLAPGERRHVLVQVVLADDWKGTTAMRDRYVVLATPEPLRIRDLVEPTRSARRGTVPAPLLRAWESGSAGPPSDLARDRTFGSAVVDLFVRWEAPSGGKRER